MKIKTAGPSGFFSDTIDLLRFELWGGYDNYKYLFTITIYYVEVHMKTLRLLSLLMLVPFCVQAMERSSFLAVSFYFNAFEVPALDKRTETIYVQEGDTFRDAVIKLNKQVRMQKGYRISYMTYDTISVPSNRWETTE